MVPIPLGVLKQGGSVAVRSQPPKAGRILNFCFFPRKFHSLGKVNLKQHAVKT